MFNMFVVALAPFKSHCYFFIYLPCKKYRSSKSKRTYLTYILKTVISCIADHTCCIAAVRLAKNAVVGPELKFNSELWLLMPVLFSLHRYTDAVCCLSCCCAVRA